jgi:fructokinase
MTTDDMQDETRGPGAGRDRVPDARPLVVGETLFDELPDGSRVLGGAPFNVAWHLQAFGMRPLLITRVGDDPAGDEVVEAMAGWGMDTAGVQRDAARPTGRVTVDLAGGEPCYHILDDQAYDFIDRDPALAAAAGAATSVLYHGTLVHRHRVSAGTVGALRAHSGAPVFIDVNLRDPWWKPAQVQAAVRRATWVKLNESELVRLTGLTLASTGDERAAAAADFRAVNGLQAVIMTLGADGALIDDGGLTHAAAPPADIRVVDTVGAGDAFAAVSLLGISRRWQTAELLARALEFASAVCAVRGATTTDRRLYSVLLDSWEGGFG